MTGRVRLTVALVLAVAVIALAFGAWTMARLHADKEMLATVLTDRLAQWLDGEVTVAEADLVGRFPNFALEAGEVRLRAAGGLAIDEIVAPRLRIEIDRGSLFWGPLRMSRLELHGPRIILGEGAGARPRPDTAREMPSLVRALRTVPVPQLSITRATVVPAPASGLDDLTDVDVELSVGEAGSSRGSGAFRWRGETVAFSYSHDAPTAAASTAQAPMRASLTAPLVAAQLRGEATIAGGLQLKGALELDIPRLRALARWLGVDMQPGPGLGAFKASGEVNWFGRRIAFDRGSFVLDGNSATGSLALEYGGPRPMASGTLALQSLNLSQYLTATGAGAARPGTAGESALDLVFLRDLDLDLRMSTTRVDARPLTMGQTALTIASRNGALAADFSVLALCGGTGNGRIEGDFSGPVPRWRFAGTLADLGAKPCIELFAAPSLVEGTAKVAANLRSRGRTLQQLLANLDGTAEFAIAEGQADIDIMKIVTQARAGDLKGWDSVRGAPMPFDTLVAKCSSRLGVAVCQGMEVKAGETRITGGGIVNLGERSLDWQLDIGDAVADRLPRMRQLLTSLVSAVVVTGSMFEPTFQVALGNSSRLRRPGMDGAPRASDRAALDPRF